MEQAPIAGAQYCLHFPYKYPISPCRGQCVTERYGCLDVTIPTKYPPLGEDSSAPPPLLSPTSAPGLPGGAYTIDRCIKLVEMTLVPVHVRWHSEDLWPCDDPPDHPHDGWAADRLRWRGRGEEPLIFGIFA